MLAVLMACIVGTNWVFFGTRPETIKMGPLIRVLPDRRTVFTGQHPDLIAPFVKFPIDVWINDTFHPGQSLADLTGNLIRSIDRVVPHGEDDVWYVQGDTTSAFAAAYVAFVRKTRVVHVEAGLRTHNMNSPFPEEFNRRTIGSIASLHMAPTQLSRDNLIAEGVPGSRIHVTGNTGIDAVRLAGMDCEDREDSILVTMHRRENSHLFDRFYDAIATECQGWSFVVAVHPNPRAKAAALSACRRHDRMKCVPPLGYNETQCYLDNAPVVITDSGGLQEEATWYGTYAIVLRESTERPEAMMVGQSVVTVDETVIKKMLNLHCDAKSPRLLPFGDGHAATRIAKALPTQSVGNYWKQTTTVDPICGISGWLECEQTGVTVVMTVYRRPKTFRLQLTSVLGQRGVNIDQILVVQSGNHVRVKELLKTVKTSIPIRHVRLDTNGWYHTRFFLAHSLSGSEYVAVLDDDVLFTTTHSIRHSINHSKSLGGALITGNGRIITSVVNNRMVQTGGFGRVDFGGHLWVLPRTHLRHYMSDPPITRRTSEDIQLSFSLLKRGILTYCGGQVTDIVWARLDAAASDTRQRLRIVRQYTMCMVVRRGFVPLQCRNCDTLTLDRCIDHNRELIKHLPAFSEKVARG